MTDTQIKNNKQYYLTKIGFDTFIVLEKTAKDFFNKKGYQVIEKMHETPDTPFYYGKRLKASIECGYNTDKKRVMYYKVTCYHKRHEVFNIRLFDVSKIKTSNYKGINKVYLQAVRYARLYLKHCKY